MKLVVCTSSSNRFKTKNLESSNVKELLSAEYFIHERVGHGRASIDQTAVDKQAGTMLIRAAATDYQVVHVSVQEQLLVGCRVVPAIDLPNPLVLARLW